MNDRKRAPIKSYHDLEVYQRARAMRRDVHRVVTTFPDHEKYDLVDQMRRASKSVAANITEGFGYRDRPAELKRYLRIAMASANEMEGHLEAALDLGYLTDVDYRRLTSEYSVIGRQLNRLIATWQRFPPSPASSIQRPASRSSRDQVS